MGNYVDIVHMKPSKLEVIKVGRYNEPVLLVGGFDPRMSGIVVGDNILSSEYVDTLASPGTRT